MVEYFKTLIDSVNRDAKGTFLVLAVFVIYILYQNVGDSNAEFIAMKNDQLKELNERLSHCESNRATDALRIDEMYSILKRQDSVIIELNSIIKYR